MKFLFLLFIVPIRVFVYLFNLQNRKIVIFGEWFGNTSSRETWHYFSSSLNSDKFEDKRKIWVTNNLDLFANRNVEAYSIYSIKGIWFQIIADYFVVNTGSNDIAYGVALFAKNFVQLGHGIPTKTFLLSENRSVFYRIILLIKFNSIEKYSKVICPFESFVTLYSKSYNVISDKIEISYVPIYRTNKKEHLKHSNLILFMPTHQNEGNSFDPIYFIDFVNSINLEKYKLIISLHPYDWKFKVDLQKVLSVYNNVEVVCINPTDYYSEVKYAITDYSGSIYQFLGSEEIKCFFYHPKNRIIKSRSFIAPPSIFNYFIIDSTYKFN